MLLKFFVNKWITQRALKTVIAVSIFTGIVFNKSYGQEYQLPESALKPFIAGKGSLTISIEDFVKKNGGRRIVLENKKWCPNPGYWIEYRHLQLRYWFEVPSVSEQQYYLGLLEEMIEDDKFEEFRKYGYVQAERFLKGDCVEEDYLMSSRFRTGTANDQKAVADLSNGLQKAFNKWGNKEGVGEDYNPLQLSEDWGSSIRDISHFQTEIQKLLAVREFAGKLNSLKNKYYQQAGIDPAMYNQAGGENPGEIDPNIIGTDFQLTLRKYGVPSPNTSNGKDEKVQDGSDNGSKGWLPVKVSFSRWLTHLFEIATKYLGIDKALKHILAIAYFIAPRLFDEVGSFLAKLQQSIIPKSLDDFLNRISDIVEHLDRFYNCFMAIKNMLTDPQFLSLFKGGLKNLKVDDIIKGIEKVATIVNQQGLISSKNFHEIESIIGYGKLFTKGDMLKNLRKFAYNKAKDMLAKTKWGKRFPFSEMENCFKTKSKEECLKILTHGAVLNMPERFSKYADAIDKLVISGDFKGAAKEAALQEINRIPEEFRKDVLAVTNGKKDFTRDDLLRISQNVMDYTGNKKLADLIRVGRGINYIAENADSIRREIATVLSNMNLSEETIADFLNNPSPELLRTMAEGFGFSDPGAQRLFVSGDINGAIQRQVERGVPDRNRAYYQNLAQDIRNRTLSRLGIYQLMLEAMRKGYIPYNLTRLIKRIQ